MARMKFLLLLAAGGVAVAAVAFLQRSFDATTPATPAALQLTPAVAPVARYDVAPVAASTGEAEPVPAKDPASTVTRTAPRRVKPHDDAPAAVIVERRENPLPASVPDVKVAPVPVMTYEQRVAAAVSGEDLDRAMSELQRLAVDQPGRPEAYEAMAGISLRKRDYDEARELMESALDHGGKATFSLIHDHSRGNFDAKDPKATCVGELTILADEVRFEAPGDGDRFSANWADVRDSGSNKFFGSGMGGFHLTITAGGKFKNINLAPESKDKAEAKLILALLSAYTRGRDRTK